MRRCKVEECDCEIGNFSAFPASRAFPAKCSGNEHKHYKSYRWSSWLFSANLFVGMIGSYLMIISERTRIIPTVLLLLVVVQTVGFLTEFAKSPLVEFSVDDEAKYSRERKRGAYVLIGIVVLGAILKIFE